MENGLNGEGEENGEKEEQPDKLVVPEKPAKKIRVTYEEYRTIANLLILHLRQVEEISEEGLCYIVLHHATLCYIVLHWLYTALLPASLYVCEG